MLSWKDYSKEALIEKCKELICENEELKIFKHIAENKILLVEDGSVDTDKLEDDGFYVIAYRQGARPPMWIEKGESE